MKYLGRKIMAGLLTVCMVLTTLLGTAMIAAADSDPAVLDETVVQTEEFTQEEETIEITEEDVQVEQTTEMTEEDVQNEESGEIAEAVAQEEQNSEVLEETDTIDIPTEVGFVDQNSGMPIIISEYSNAGSDNQIMTIAADDPMAVDASEAALALAKALAPDGDSYDTSKVIVSENTVKLLADVTTTSVATISAEGPVILDLNGHTISKSKAPVLTIPKDTDLTITDSSNNPGRIVSGTGTLSGTINLTGTGKLTFEKITVESTGTGSSAYAIYGATTSTMIVNSGTIIGTFSSGLYNNTNGNNVINGGSIKGDISSLIEKYVALTADGCDVVYTAGDGSSVGGTITSGKVTKFEVVNGYTGPSIAHRTIGNHETYLAEGDLSLLLNGLNGTNTETIYVTGNAEIYKSFNTISTLKPENTLVFNIAPGVKVTGALSFDGPANMSWTGGGNFDAEITVRNANNKGYVVDKSNIANGIIDVRVENATCKIGNTYYGSLENAITAAKNSDDGTITIEMVDDEEIADAVLINFAKTIILDLNEHSITATQTGVGWAGSALTVYGNANLTVTGNGTIDSKNGDIAICIGASTPKTTVTIDKDVVVKSKTGVLIQPLGSNADSSTANAEVIVYGTLNGTEHGLNIHGQLVNGKGIVKVMDGAYISGADGIYAAGNSDITVNEGATITGTVCGIEIRAGKLTVNGGTISSTADSFSVNPNGSGGTTIGAGIAVAQHTTELPIEVIINGGTITGYVGLNIADPQNNNLSGDITIDVSGGDFIATNPDAEDSVSVNVQEGYDVGGFVEGGNFSDSLMDTGYLDSSLQAELESTRKNPDAPFSYFKSMTDALNDAEDGDTVTHIESMESPETTAPITFNSGYDDISIVMYVERGTYTVHGNEYFKHPEGKVFLGWKDDNGTFYNEGDTIELDNAGITLIAQWGVDKTALRETIEEADALDEGSYTADSWKELTDVLNAANSVLSDENATQKEVDEATSALQAAIDALEKKTESTTTEAPAEEPSEEITEAPTEASTGESSEEPTEETDVQTPDSGNEPQDAGAKTGDDTVLWVWTLLMLISISGLTATVTSKRARKK